MRVLSWFFWLPIVVLLTAAPAAANEAAREDVRALAAVFSELGFGEEAAQMEALAESYSAEELEALASMGINRATAAFEVLAEVNQAIAIPSWSDDESSTSGSAGATRALGQGTSGVACTVDTDCASDLPCVNKTCGVSDPPPGFPTAAYVPNSAVLCGQTERADTSDLVGAWLAVQAARVAYEIVEAIYLTAESACNIVVVGIGVGGNPQGSVCIGTSIAFSVAKTALFIADGFVEGYEKCDGGVDAAEIEGSYERLVYLQGYVADTRVEILNELSDIKDAIAELQKTLDLLKKSQLEIAMNANEKIRPSVFYEERYAELCSIAQEAIDELPDVYVQSSNAAKFMLLAKNLEVTDPKRAADYCVNAFTMATKRSTRLQ